MGEAVSGAPGATRRTAAGWLAAIGQHRRAVLWTLVGVGVGLRVLLVWGCPLPFGYVYDYYHESIELFYAKGRLPIATDCWQCYHPPLYYVLGVGFYAVGRWLATAGADVSVWGLRALSVMPLLAGAVTSVYSYRLVRFVLRDRGLAAVGAGIIAAFPCLFISSYAPESDILVAAAMAALLFYLTREFVQPGLHTWKHAVLLGVLAGLAASAKYSGLIGLGTAGSLYAWRLLAGPDRARVVRHGVIVLLVCVVVGSYRYVDNAKRFGNPLYANGTAGEAFSADRQFYRDQYEFFTFRLGDLFVLARPGAPAGQLTTLPVYYSVWTSLYAMGWGDMSFFSTKGRIGDDAAPYPSKQIPPWLTESVLVLGLVPTALALPGLLLTLRRRLYAPLLVMLLLTLGSYLPWVVAQQEWALKTKYIVFLLPIYVIYAMVGLQWMRRKWPAVAAAATLAALMALVAASHLYLYAFSVGHL
ncbi:MAG: phospholipid carrier-dependent glycosyltransferase [Acidobacteriota bacterium]